MNVELERYPVILKKSEQIIVLESIYDYKQKMVGIFKQLMENKDKNVDITINMNAYEMGVITALMENCRHDIPETWRQLIEYKKKFMEQDGVVTEDLGNNLVKLTDKDGTTLIREKYDWEKD